MDSRFLKGFIGILLVSQTAFANDNGWLAGAGLGVANRNLSSSTSVFNGTPVPAPFNQDIYTINSDNNAGVLALFGGYQWVRTATYIPYYSLTLHYEHQFDADITGQVQQYALPIFTNYNYEMTLSSDILGVIGKAGLIQYKSLVPYLSAGVGVAFNQVHSYSEEVLVAPGRISPHYGSNNNTNFAYTFGTGVDISCYKNLGVSFAYEYWNLGKINSDNGAASWSTEQLDFGTLTSNTVLVTVNYWLA